MRYHWGQKAAEKRNVVTLNRTYQAKWQYNFDSGWLEQQQCDLQSLEPE